MFEPKYSKDDETLLWRLEEIERVQYRVERQLIMPKHEVWLRRGAFIRTAYSSTMVENNTISEEEMENVARASPASEIPPNRPDVINYAKALSFVDFLSDDKDLPFYEPVIRQIHWLLMNEIHDTQIKPGQYRTVPNWIEDRGVRVFEPPMHIDIPILMREFSNWLRESTEMHPVIRGGIAHAHLVAIHPFVDGNGRTARLLATLVLQHDGYGFRKLLSLDGFYQRNRDEYVTALMQCIGKHYTADYDSTPWLQFFSESILAQAYSLEGKLTDWRIKVDDVHRKWSGSGLNERQIDGIIYAVNVGYVTRKDYIEIAGVSPLTATRDLQTLVSKDFLVAEGQGRNRRYRIHKPEKGEEEEGTQKELL